MEDRHVAKVMLGGDPKLLRKGIFFPNSAGVVCCIRWPQWQELGGVRRQNMPKFMAEEMKKVDNGDSDEIEGAVNT